MQKTFFNNFADLFIIFSGPLKITSARIFCNTFSHFSSKIALEASGSVKISSGMKNRCVWIVSQAEISHGDPLRELFEQKSWFLIDFWLCDFILLSQSFHGTDFPLAQTKGQNRNGHVLNIPCIKNLMQIVTKRTAVKAFWAMIEDSGMFWHGKTHSRHPFWPKALLSISFS